MLTLEQQLARAHKAREYHTQRHIRISERKAARTLIYRALYGTGGKIFNTPWLDSGRKRPQDWSIELMLDTIRHNWRTASFDDFRQRILLSDINNLLEVRGHDRIALKDLQS